MAKFNSILIANRGEIALRIMKTAKGLGYRIIAVYSQADADAPHVKFADEAVCIGPAPVGESYLVPEKILEAAKQTSAGAIHPGYGFLSENADFAKACTKAGLVFIGPSAEAIELMGNKAEAKRRMKAAGVPCVPGYEGEDQADKTFITEATKIGFPVMVKAVAGGGGRGMRLVQTAKALPAALKSARSEAQNAFGNGDLLLEKAVMRPRHVEVQVFADMSGTTIHLGERDCSIQRRHQKIIEEAPCPVLTSEQRAQMGAAAIEAAKSINYVGAGTVEFLLDTDGAFYFLEMNTRLQVEHPVTEMVTGLDLVALQIKTAQGEDLGLCQDDIVLSGHAIEARLYAEDVAQDFLPVTGHVDVWKAVEADGVRVDTGIATGSDVSPFYDPMLAKIIAWGETRDIAINRLRTALAQTRLFGVTSNKGFLVDILDTTTFANGEATTAFISEEFAELKPVDVSVRTAAIAAVLDYEMSAQSAQKKSLGIHGELMNWGSSGALLSHYRYARGEDTISLTVTTSRAGRYKVQSGEETLNLTILKRDALECVLEIDGTRLCVGYLAGDTGCMDIDVEGQVMNFNNQCVITNLAHEVGGGGRVVAPMHGTLLELFVKTGDTVEQGTRLAILEAMKMQHDILAEISGIVVECVGVQGDQISANDLILTIEALAKT